MCDCYAKPNTKTEIPEDQTQRRYQKFGLEGTRSNPQVQLRKLTTLVQSRQTWSTYKSKLKARKQRTRENQKGKYVG